ncbi:hypothetical protein L917_02627 [Phytophthora nicotianae]|uniref:SWIM-type domain-containing protein n=1 Tax=Phytophthora nicotianae TaxID=4792 RepID=W2LVN1_PHYNI|nr:hypothetical protein L917_02627 [Phytophthora nicotianae]
MTDKAIHEKDVLREEFPDARQLLCQWHVITWLNKQATRLAPKVKEDIGNVPHLTNNTNNRIESKWGKLKDVIDDTFTIDQLLSTLITLQQYSEDRYLAKYHHVGSRPSRCSEDKELSIIALHFSPFAFKMVSDEHALAIGPCADYKVDILSSGIVKVASARSGNVYEVNVRGCSCNCIFVASCLLPCRHVMYVRRTCNYETVLPPLHFLASRWIVRSPQNNIDTGEIPVGGLKQGLCPSRTKERGLSGSTMYCEAKAVAEKIMDRMALQSTPTFRVALRWLEDFYAALNAGEVVNFAHMNPSVFPGLSQLSSVSGARLSQMSLGVPPRQNEVLQEKRETAVAKDATEADQSNKGGKLSERTESTQKSTKSTANQAFGGAEGACAVDWTFAERPIINGMTKAQRKREKAKEDTAKARELAAIYRKDKVPRYVTFDEVAALL